MASDRFSLVLRIMKNETRLLERADQKAISLLSILGVFMVFFIVYYRLIPVNFFTVAMVTVYFGLALFAIWHLIMVVRPRVEGSQGREQQEAPEPASADPMFFQGICTFPNPSVYRELLERLAEDDDATMEIYARQVFTLARINAVKYKYVQRGVVLVIATLAAELAIIAYLFAYHMDGMLPFQPGL